MAEAEIGAGIGDFVVIGQILHFAVYTIGSDCLMLTFRELMVIGHIGLLSAQLSFAPHYMDSFLDIGVPTSHPSVWPPIFIT